MVSVEIWRGENSLPMPLILHISLENHKDAATALLHGSWERTFYDFKLQHREISPGIEWGEGKFGEAPCYPALSLLGYLGWATFQEAQNAATASCYRQNIFFEAEKHVREVYFYQNKHSHWTDLANDTYLMQKILVDISPLVKIKSKLRREAHNCKSIVSIKTRNTGWLTKRLFYDGNGSEVIISISNICHALQLLSCQCTQHIINKWVTGKQLEI